VIMAHDLGTTGDKASIHDDRGALVASVTVHYPTHYGHDGHVEQLPAHWWNAVCEATKRLFAATGSTPDEITAIGFSGQMMGAVLLDDNGEPVRPALIWADHRSVAQTDRLVAAIGMDAAYRIIGHRLNPTYTIEKIMWVRDNEPDIFARVRNVCLAKDWIVRNLTGRLVTDPSDASSTNAFDQGEGVWSNAVIDAARLSRDLFPEIVPSASVVGGVTREAAQATGLREGTPVVIGGGDGPLAALGSGVIHPQDGAYVYLGSSSWVSFASEKPLLDPQMRTMTFNHVVPGRYVPTATMQAGAGSLHWIADLLDPAGGAKRFERLIDGTSGLDAANEGLFFLPHLLGERSPYWNPHTRAAFVGLGRQHGPRHLTCAVLEGVAFNLATCVNAFREGGAVIETVDAIGGGAASDTWLQMFADIWGATIRRRSIVEEANSLGAAVTAGIAVGTIPSFDAARDLSTVTASFEPDPTRHAAYTRAHERFLDAYGRLEPWYAPPQTADAVL